MKWAEKRKENQKHRQVWKTLPNIYVNQFLEPQETSSVSFGVVQKELLEKIVQTEKK